ARRVASAERARGDGRRRRLSDGRPASLDDYVDELMEFVDGDEYVSAATAETYNPNIHDPPGPDDLAGQRRTTVRYTVMDALSELRRREARRCGLLVYDPRSDSFVGLLRDDAPLDRRAFASAAGLAQILRAEFPGRFSPGSDEFAVPFGSLDYPTVKAGTCPSRAPRPCSTSARSTSTRRRGPTSSGCPRRASTSGASSGSRSWATSATTSPASPSRPTARTRGGLPRREPRASPPRAPRGSRPGRLRDRERGASEGRTAGHGARGQVRRDDHPEEALRRPPPEVEGGDAVGRGGAVGRRRRAAVPVRRPVLRPRRPVRGPRHRQRDARQSRRDGAVPVPHRPGRTGGHDVDGHLDEARDARPPLPSHDPHAGLRPPLHEAVGALRPREEGPVGPEGEIRQDGGRPCTRVEDRPAGHRAEGTVRHARGLRDAPPVGRGGPPPGRGPVVPAGGVVREGVRLARRRDEPPGGGGVRRPGERTERRAEAHRGLQRRRRARQGLLQLVQPAGEGVDRPGVAPRRPGGEQGEVGSRHVGKLVVASALTEFEGGSNGELL
ncbi:hypothetical protein THAOC_32930, partial [Thalassiosira oceanica]